MAISLCLLPCSWAALGLSLFSFIVPTVVLGCSWLLYVAPGMLLDRYLDAPVFFDCPLLALGSLMSWSWLLLVVFVVAPGMLMSCSWVAPVFYLLGGGDAQLTVGLGKDDNIIIVETISLTIIQLILTILS